MIVSKPICVAYGFFFYLLWNYCSMYKCNFVHLSKKVIPMTNNTANTVKKEHERRFFPILSMLPASFYDHPRTVIVQGYLEDDLRTRLRDECDEHNVHKFLQTRKVGEGISRDEDEIEISNVLFDDLWKEVTCELRKTRYHFPWNGHIVEINIFHDELDHYVQIEVEFKTHEEAASFVPPEWFGEEVTDDKRHENYHLAKFGITFSK